MSEAGISVVGTIHMNPCSQLHKSVHQPLHAWFPSSNKNMLCQTYRWAVLLKGLASFPGQFNKNNVIHLYTYTLYMKLSGLTFHHSASKVYPASGVAPIFLLLLNRLLLGYLCTVFMQCLEPFACFEK